MKASDFKTTRAVVIERPYEANLRGAQPRA